MKWEVYYGKINEGFPNMVDFDTEKEAKDYIYERTGGDGGVFEDYTYVNYHENMEYYYVRSECSDLEASILYKISLVTDREELKNIITAAKGQIELLDEMDGISDVNTDDSDVCSREHEDDWMNDPEAVHIY